jgi:uridine phosphorylase
MIDEYAALGVLSFEMEAGTLLKMGGVYGFAAGCVLGIVAQRTEDENPDLAAKDVAVDNAVRVAIAAADAWAPRP